MNKPMKFWLGVIGLSIVGGLTGYMAAVWSDSERANQLSINHLYVLFPMDWVFVLFALSGLIFITQVIIGLKRISSQTLALRKTPSTNEEAIYSDEEIGVGKVLTKSVLLSAVSLFFLFLVIPFQPQVHLDEWSEWIHIGMMMMSVVYVVVSQLLQRKVLKHYNRIYPKRTFDLHERSNSKAKSDFISKMDEFELHQTHQAAFEAYNKTRLLSLTLLFISSFYSIVIEPEYLAILIAGAIYFYHQYAYLAAVKRITGHVGSMN